MVSPTSHCHHAPQSSTHSKLFFSASSLANPIATSSLSEQILTNHRSKSAAATTGPGPSFAPDDTGNVSTTHPEQPIRASLNNLIGDYKRHLQHQHIESRYVPNREEENHTTLQTAQRLIRCPRQYCEAELWLGLLGRVRNESES